MHDDQQSEPDADVESLGQSSEAELRVVGATPEELESFNDLIRFDHMYTRIAPPATEEVEVRAVDETGWSDQERNCQSSCSDSFCCEDLPVADSDDVSGIIEQCLTKILSPSQLVELSESMGQLVGAADQLLPDHSIPTGVDTSGYLLPLSPPASDGKPDDVFELDFPALGWSLDDGICSEFEDTYTQFTQPWHSPVSSARISISGEIDDTNSMKVNSVSRTMYNEISIGSPLSDSDDCFETDSIFQHLFPSLA